MSYSDFKNSKGRSVLVFKTIDKNDLLVLPLTSNFQREGILINNKDIREGSLKKDSVVIVPKLTAIEASLILGSRFIASLKEKSFDKVKKELCVILGC